MENAKLPTHNQSGQSNSVSSITPATPRSRHHRTSRRKDSKRSKRIRSLRLINFLLTVTLIAVLAGWINTWVNYNSAEAERVESAAALRHKTAQLEQLQIRTDELNANLSALVQQRLPNLKELQFDTTFPIDDEYVRNVSFTRTGVENKWRYQYSMVLENRSRDIVVPKIRIILFDESGIQTGSIKITPGAATSNADLEYLEPAEIRAYTGEIPSEPGTDPRYFKVRLG